MNGVESFAQASYRAVRAISVRSALNSMLWLTTIVTPLLLFGAWEFQADPLIEHLLIIASLFPPAVTIVGFFYFMFKDPGKLQSETYQLRHELLQMIKQERTGELKIDPNSQPAGLNPAANLIAGANPAAK